jgi:hypothetical protein
MSEPQSVIHIKFDARNLLFNPALVWGELRKAVQAGKLSQAAEANLKEQYSDIALSIVTRSDLMRVATQELNTSRKELFDSLPPSAPRLPDSNDCIVSNENIIAARDRVLLHTDSVFFEFRSYLEFLAKFVYGILQGVHEAPAPKQTLSSGETIQLVTPKGIVITHNFLLFLCDQLPASAGAPHVCADWFIFLSGNRNLFTHGVAPYCAIEERNGSGRRFDVLIMRKNILDFKTAMPSDYFRISDLQRVVQGVKDVSLVAQSYVMKKIAGVTG